MGAILPPACSAIRISSVDSPVEYLLVRYADVGLINVPSHLADEQVILLSDIF